jgi:hypothetical protein
LALTRRFFLFAALGWPAWTAQPVLAPCIASAREGGALRLVFRAPQELRSRRGGVVLLVHMRDRPPERVRINGVETVLVSRARGWASLELPRGTRFDRLRLEPGDPFDGCSDAATAPYLVFDPPPKK